MRAVLSSVVSTISFGKPVFLNQTGEHRPSCGNMMFNRLGEPTPSFLCIHLHTPPKCIHHTEHIHGLTIPLFRQTAETSGGLHVPTHGLRRFRSAVFRVKFSKPVLCKGIALFR